MSLHLGGFFFVCEKLLCYLKIYFRQRKALWSRACVKGYKIRILHYPPSRLTREQELWARYTTHVVTESDLWMSALRSHSRSSFKVFPSMLHYTSQVFIWQGLMAKWAVWIFIISNWWWITYSSGALRCQRLLLLSPYAQRRGGKPVCVLANLTGTFHAFTAFVFPKKRAHRFALHRCTLMCTQKKAAITWTLVRVSVSSVFALTESSFTLGHSHIVTSVPQTHLHVQYPSVLMWCFSKCFSVMLQWIKHGRLLSSCPRWKHGNMAASAGACEKSWTVCLFRLVCKFIYL